MLPLIFDVGKIARRNKQRVGRLIPGFFLLCAPSFDCCTIRLEVDFRNRALFFFALLDIFNHPITFYCGAVKIYAQNYLQARLSEVSRQ